MGFPSCFQKRKTRVKNKVPEQFFFSQVRIKGLNLFLVTAKNFLEHAVHRYLTPFHKNLTNNCLKVISANKIPKSFTKSKTFRKNSRKIVVKL